MDLTMQQLAEQARGKTVRLVISGREKPIYGVIVEEIPEGSETAIFQQILDYRQTGKREAIPKVVERWIYGNEITEFEILKD